MITGSELCLINMTSEQVWEPYSKDYAEREEEARTVERLNILYVRRERTRSRLKIRQTN